MLCSGASTPFDTFDSFPSVDKKTTEDIRQPHESEAVFLFSLLHDPVKSSTTRTDEAEVSLMSPSVDNVTTEMSGRNRR